MAHLQIIQGDITKIPADAVVNAANTQLSGGGGVDEAIHQVAGMEALNQACAQLHGCATGQAKVTPAFNLPAKIIIHTPGPIWQGGQHHEAQLLAACYNNSLRQASAHHCHKVLFPSISTGVYGYPLALAAPIAIKTIQAFPATMEVQMVCFDQITYQAYLSALRDLS
ncbi:macro domain-containing protein [Bombilactobacillus bombi]|uniref:macro domain-containing protein n=1 Tax=Bombilactobacillus bombi TaxID=1303590 RepID=UPI0015E5AE82|nr:macro domain-containing protein [Bombilactobacillus bombi]MBA1433723.1 macro domain-containing protein [Bombilactobacillus bombi]